MYVGFAENFGIAIGDHMLLSDYVQPDSILLNLDAAGKDDLLRQLIDAALKSPIFTAQPPDVGDKLEPMIMRRESSASTAIGNGILFPHARLPGFRGLLLLVATCRRPLETPTPDGEPVFMACFAVVPAERPALGLKIASALARLFASEEARNILRRARCPHEVAVYLTAHDEILESVITMRDLFRPYEWSANPETPVREIARQLLRCRMPGVAVVGDKAELLGEVTLTRLQRFGLPEFIETLIDVSLVRQLDPFEHYFLKEAGATARDVMNTEVSSLPEDGTLMEAVHALAINRRALVHVCRDDRPVGYVDSATILNRVLAP